MAKIDQASVTARRGTGYPPPHDAQCQARETRRLSDAAGLTQFGVVTVRLEPGAWSSQRHWHEKEDEFVYVLEGEVVLVTDAGEEVMGPGDCAGFPAGRRDGHHFQNRSAQDALILAVGSRDDADHGEYSDIDMKFGAGRYSNPSPAAIFTRKDGSSLL